MSETRDLAAKRAYEAGDEFTSLVSWEELDHEERARWGRVADAVLATLDWETDSAIVQRIDRLDEQVRGFWSRVRQLERKLEGQRG